MQCKTTKMEWKTRPILGYSASISNSLGRKRFLDWVDTMVRSYPGEVRVDLWRAGPSERGKKLFEVPPLLTRVHIYRKVLSLSMSLQEKKQIGKQRDTSRETNRQSANTDRSGFRSSVTLPESRYSNDSAFIP